MTYDETIEHLRAMQLNHREFYRLQVCETREEEERRVRWYYIKERNLRRLPRVVVPLPQ